MAQKDVRPFAEADVGPVAELYQRAFRKTDRPASPALRRVFAELFLDGPVAAPDVPSLVRVDEAGRVIGFIGALTRGYTLRGRSLRGVAATEIMVDARAPRTGFVVFELLGALLAGPQDFTFSDGTWDVMQDIWVRKGGERVAYYSLEWTRVLRPVESKVLRYTRHPRFGPRIARLTPLARGLDRARPRPPAAGALRGRTVGVDEYLAAVALAGPEVALRTASEPATLSWVLRHVGATRRQGALRCRLVDAPDGGLAGGTCVLIAPGAVAQVLHMNVAAPRLAADLVADLLHDAWEEGAVAVAGQADERFRKALSAARATFTLTDFSFMAHARDRDVLAAIQRGDTNLTRLDGEWWSRLGVDRLLDW
jgi:hypothetical protein